ncbi:MAG TPA: GDP-mannose 4,6-dehydratase [Patescibacteria group bacterium]|nr:GDP-mannose 4,6-dehydratase [Patescibacteria group bacterium]
MRILVTGVTGFAGSFLAELLLDSGHDVYGLVHPDSSHQPCPDHDRFTPLTGNILVQNEVDKVFLLAKPHLVYHLAGQASPVRSWEIPAQTFAVNTGGTANILLSAQENGQPRVVVVTSAHMYGTIGLSSTAITEETIPAPADPYGISKWAAGQLVSVYYRRYGLPVIEARPFNHIGPRQTLGFVVPDFASQIAAIKLGLREPVIKVGNLSVRRDFTDVRDVAEAYRKLGLEGRAGETYLVCSGKTVSIRGILDKIIEIAGVKVTVEEDPDRVRPADNNAVVGSYSKLQRETGWEPQITLAQSLSDVFNEWLGTLSG